MSSGITAEVFDIYRQRPSVAVLMSGAGSNAVALLENDEFRDLYDIRTIVTDNPLSNAQQIAERFDLRYMERPKSRFITPEEREEYFLSLHKEIGNLGVNTAIYAGFMKIATPEFCEAFPGVNVHPADLSVKDADGMAKYRGMNALSLMRKDLMHVASTVHVVDNPVDSGSAISVSSSLPVEDSTIPDHMVHEELKALEHLIFPQTLILLGRGSISSLKIPYSQAEIEEIYYA